MRQIRVKKRPIRGAIFGLIAGCGLGLLLVSHSIMVAGKLTPFLAVGLTVLIGITLGLAGPKRRKEPKDRITRREQRLLKG